MGLAAVDEAAAELGISRRQVYALVSRWRAGEGMTSDLCPAGPAAAGLVPGCRTRSRQSCGTCCARGI
ncbi:helix-turn-helix domain-containing protein [Flindersiella endophytica]